MRGQACYTASNTNYLTLENSFNMSNDRKASVQQQFGDHAQNYVTSSVHATGEDLDTLVRLAAPKPDDVVLDVGTGGGHTALRLAPQVQKVVATDITDRMLDAARAFITPQADNVTFEIADAQDLPFEDATFDLVTCRIAAHHFEDVYEFVLEAARVLKPGGRLVVQDQYTPDDEASNRIHRHIRATTGPQPRSSAQPGGLAAHAVRCAVGTGRGTYNDTNRSVYPVGNTHRSDTGNRREARHVDDSSAGRGARVAQPHGDGHTRCKYPASLSHHRRAQTRPSSLTGQRAADVVQHLQRG